MSVVEDTAGCIRRSADLVMDQFTGSDDEMDTPLVVSKAQAQTHNRELVRRLTIWNGKRKSNFVYKVCHGIPLNVSVKR